jgi:glycosyltransferase involved in cell wall biosynthesis
VLRLSIIIPAYNEESTIIPLLERVAQQSVPGVEFETIVIDDGSMDRTIALLEAHPHLYTHLVRQPRNGGKGAAVKAGLGKASGDYVLFQDADLEYDPADYVKLMDPILRFEADLVMGSRLLAPTYTRVYYYWHKVGNRFLTLVFNVLNNSTFTDIYTCYLVYRRTLLEPADLKSEGWEQHAEILSRVWAKAKACYEVPINYHGRTYGEGKKIRAHHAFAVLAMIVRARFMRYV